METIVIEGKDYKCSKRVAEEILWMDSKVKVAKKLVKMIEDEMEEFDTQYRQYVDRVNDLTRQLNNL